MSTIKLLNITDSWTTLFTGQCTQCLTYSTNYFQGLTQESWFTNLEQTPPNRCKPLTASYKRLVHDINITNEPNSAMIAVITPLPAFYSQYLDRNSPYWLPFNHYGVILGNFVLDLAINNSLIDISRYSQNSTAWYCVDAVRVSLTIRKRLQIAFSVRIYPSLGHICFFFCYVLFWLVFLYHQDIRNEVLVKLFTNLW